jgi:putative ABC transport system permease protein
MPGQVAGGGTAEFKVHGILESGAEEDDQIIISLAVAQKLSGSEGRIRRIEVSALTKPEDAFARSDVTQLSGEEFDRWYCTPYVSSICYQIQQAIPGAEARPVYRVTETEGNVLSRVGVLMALLAGAAVVASVLAVASMMLVTVLERRAEIGLFKSLGATDARVAAVFLLEALVVGLAGGVAGFFAGSLMARHLAAVVFGLPAAVHWVIFPGAVALAVAVTLTGSALPLARGLRLSPIETLRNE